jgi:hypothetical protein
MTGRRTIENQIVINVIALWISLWFVHGYTQEQQNIIETEKTDLLRLDAVTAAQYICQQRMLDGVYGNDEEMMNRDLENEIQRQLKLRKLL